MLLLMLTARVRIGTEARTAIASNNLTVRLANRHRLCDRLQRVMLIVSGQWTAPYNVAQWSAVPGDHAA
jgi:hypothetical protein